MKWRRLSTVIYIVVCLALLPGFTVQKKTMFCRGKIEAVGTGFQFIVVNGTKVFISSATKILDEKGGTLTIGNLKPGTNVVIDGARDKQDFLAKRIMVKTRKTSKP